MILRLTQATLLSLLFTTLLSAQSNVGIGTTSPEMKVHMAEADSTILLLENSIDLQDNASNGLYFKTGNGGIRYTGALKTIGESNSSARLGLFTYASSSTQGLRERLSISDGGFVGVGTTNPLRTLHLSDTRRELLLLENRDALDVDIQNAMIFKTGNGTRSYTGGIKTIGTSTFEARLGLFSGTAVGSDGLQKMLSILNNGDIGIGTITPEAKLHINEQSNELLSLQNEMPLNLDISSDLAFKIGSSSSRYHAGAIKAIGDSQTAARLGFFTSASTNEGMLQERMSISDGGNVGIGSTAPLANLHISSFGQDLLIVENQTSLNIDETSAMYFKTGTSGTSYTGAIKTIGTNTQTARLGLFSYASGDKTGLKERISIVDSGDVGIGTISPQAKMHIVGDLLIQDGSQGEGKVLTSNAVGGASWQAPAGCNISVGDTYQGGLVFYVDETGCHGLMANVVNESSDYKWSSTSTSTYAVGLDIYAGEHNTNRIVEEVPGIVFAAFSCTSSLALGHNDWYLPSRMELDMMHLYLRKQGLGGFGNGWYWSSTESNSSSAWAQYFGSGEQATQNKQTNNKVRAIRSF